MRVRCRPRWNLGFLGNEFEPRDDDDPRTGDAGERLSASGSPALPDFGDYITPRSEGRLHVCVRHPGGQPRVHRRRHSGVQPARPPTPSDLSGAPRRRAVGEGRRAGRAARPRRDCEHVYTCARRRGRARLREPSVEVVPGPRQPMPLGSAPKPKPTPAQTIPSDQRRYTAVIVQESGPPKTLPGPMWLCLLSFLNPSVIA